MKLVECVPNFSEGRDRKIVNEIARAIAFHESVKILDMEMDPDHNRSVITFVAPIDIVSEAAFRGIRKAAELIDMDSHKGTHPRFGAADVVPFIPLYDTTMEECVEIARNLGKRVGEELGIPVYLYEKAAFIDWRRNLPDIRNEKFQYEQLREHINEEKWKPDYGPQKVGKAGATIIGARDFLIAFNVNLNTKNIEIAKKIARDIRERNGGLKNVRALGFDLKERGLVQVSMNLINYKETPINRVFELIKSEAERYGVTIAGSEVVGLIPLDALVQVADFYLRLENFSSQQILEKKIWEGDEKMLENMSIRKFLEELSSSSPTPGGGAASALVGSIAASLSSMVANLTIGKKKYQEVESEMKEIAKEAVRLRDELFLIVDEDVMVFNKIMDALKLPKETEEQVRLRKEKIEEASKEACEVPLKTARLCLEVMKLAFKVTEKGNKNAISDGACSAYFAHSALQGALLNIRINLKNISDENYKKMMHENIQNLIKESSFILEKVEEKINEVI
ncbi:MAG: glutamate formimidoyltransferase [Thermoplasmata archaeon]|jgi:glutamate formiminotransferase/formiminotetrahydrofolate cyclodeaminase|nr:glutamate formimidoyltransferase [Euryarchaeota archaeon]MVT35824.1 glutamate formimidoyltransferase [Euryarchaeota archaeon]